MRGPLLSWQGSFFSVLDELQVTAQPQRQAKIKLEPNLAPANIKFSFCKRQAACPTTVHISESEPHLHGVLAPLSRAKAPTYVMETNG